MAADGEQVSRQRPMPLRKSRAAMRNAQPFPIRNEKQGLGSPPVQRGPRGAHGNGQGDRGADRPNGAAGRYGILIASRALTGIAERASFVYGDRMQAISPMLQKRRREAGSPGWKHPAGSPRHAKPTFPGQQGDRFNLRLYDMQMRLAFQPNQQLTEARNMSLRFQLHAAIRKIAHPVGQAQTPGQIQSCIPKAHPLHLPIAADAPARLFFVHIESKQCPSGFDAPGGRYSWGSQPVKAYFHR